MELRLFAEWLNHKAIIHSNFIRIADMKEKPRIFISYSRKDGFDFARDLRQKLEKLGLSLWQDIISLEGGRDFWLQITEALDNVEFMVLVLTDEAMQSPIVRKEWRLCATARCVRLSGAG